CDLCGKEFKRRSSEVEISRRKGLRSYCSRECINKGTLEQKRANGRKMGRKNAFFFLIPGNRKDEFSPFRYFTKRTRMASIIKRYGESDLTLEYLKELWEKQKGKCFISGLVLYLPETTLVREREKKRPNWASLDRTNPKMGYVVGNVQYVALSLNLAKSNFEESEISDLMNESVENFINPVSPERIQAKVPEGRMDKFSPFRYFTGKANSRDKASKYTKNNLTLEFLRDLWELQGGRCAISGVNLIMPDSMSKRKGTRKHPKWASLDRIDSSEGYIIGNVQYVALSFNFAKSDFGEKEFSSHFKNLMLASLIAN
ncbi:MAG: hypothetical protein KAX20_08050, partial [Candidatus Omnitrophica bacterium]|nr:hypothetical protein [Candidatus Omnitrophota bacterium]